MKLQGRNLSIRMTGEDVKLLQSELAQLGYTIPADEVEKAFFGKVTRQVVLEFQKAEGLETTGIVDEKTAERINAKVDAKEPEKYLVRGHITQSNGTTSTALMGAAVRAYDWDVNGKNLLGEATTNENGAYEITYTADQFRRSNSERDGADLVVNVFNSEGQLLATSKRKNNAQPEETIDLTVPVMEPAPQEDKFVVKGTIHQADGDIFVGAIVRAFDKDLRREQPLGEKITDRDGNYEITYTRTQFQQAEKNSADLVVRVFSQTGELQVSSPTIFNAQPVEIVNLTGGSDSKKLSEYERILADLRPLLREQPIVDLREDDADDPEVEKYQDISFLAGETAWSNDRLEHLVISHRLRDRFQIPPAFFYALLRENTLLKADIAAALQARFAITLKTPLQPLFYDVVLLDPETVRKAIKQAIVHNVVPASLSQQLDEILKLLLQSIDEAKAYYQNEQPRRILNLIEKNITSGKVEAVLKILQTDIHGNIPGLLEQLTQVDIFRDTDETTDARTKLQLGELVGFDEQIIEAVRTLQGIDQPEDIRRLAALNRADWKAVLTESADRLNPGGTPINKALIDSHASSLVRKMEVRFPTVAFAAQLERDQNSPLAQQSEMLKVFNDHPDFDLATTNIDAFFRRSTMTLDPATDSELLKDDLKAAQRVFKLTPNYRKTNTLLQAGIHSAQSIYAMGETQFVNQFSGNKTFTPKEAKEVYQKAADIHTATMFLATEIKTQMQAMEVRALAAPGAAANLEAITKEFPNFKSLFQLTDLCECEHCRSVYSPAAYLADVLQFLKNRLVKDTSIAGSVSVKKAKDVLFERRPDIGDIDLSCENTNTPLPYIDVVCELLEEAIAPDAGIAFNGAISKGIITQPLLTLLQANRLPITNQAVIYDLDSQGNYTLRDKKLVCKIIPNGTGQWMIKRLRQTTLTAPELAAAPEYLNEGAYNILQTSSYAFHLPFDLFQQEAGSYFEQFGIQRADLMQAFQVSASPTNYDIAAAALNLTDAERQLIVTPNAANQNLYWNTGAITPATALKVVDIFLQKSELTYTELTKLLELSFINPTNTLFIKHLDSTCDTQKKEITSLDNDALDRIHRFIRLWKKTGWEMTTLNRAIQSPRLGNQQLTDDTLVKLQKLIALREKLGLTLDDLCTFYGTIPSEGENSRYQQIFLNAAANGVIDELLLPEKVKQNETASPATQKNITDVQATLALCLAIKPIDLTKLITSLGTNVILSFANLAAIYSLNLLAKTLKLNIEELLSLQSLTGINVLTSPADTLKFIEKVEKINTAGIKALDLQYLLTHQVTNLGDRTLPEATITTWLGKIQADYQKAFDATKSPYDAALTADENKNLIQDWLAKLSTFSAAADLAKFMSIVDDRWQSTTQTPATFIDEKLSQYIDTAPIKTAQAAFAGATSPKETERKELIRLVLVALSDYFFRQEKQRILIQSVVNMFKLDEAIALVLLKNAQLKEPTIASPKTLVDLLTTDSLIDKTNTPPIFPAVTLAAFTDQYRAIRLLHKMVFCLTPLQLKPEEIEWFLKHNAALGWLELDRLPYDTGIPSISFTKWEMLIDGLRWVQAYPPVPNPANPDRPISFYTVLDLVLQPAAIGVLQQTLATLTGWDITVLQTLHTHFTFSVADYKTPATYQRLAQAATLLRQLGMDLATTQQLIKPVLSNADVSQLRTALKVRYEESQWLEVLKGIQDRLRHQKRDALVAYLLAVNPNLNGSNDLYDYFLIDVEMCACQPTSRIVQAHGTLQLFIQRCLMDLEPTSVADVKLDNSWNQWKWMKNYRVWEANRKVFLYPENWIEPELRDDKSPLFKDLETELLQNELNDHTVEDATINYLQKLDDIAFLEVCAIYYQTDIYTMHVFARTKGGDPAVYYYRRFEQERTWTPWEKVDLDISSDHLMTFVRNSRLYLAWVVFTEEANMEQSITFPDVNADKGKEVEKAKKRWKVQLAISEFSGKKWLPKKISKEGLITTDLYEVLPAKEDFRFTVLDLGQAGYTINCTFVDSGKVTINSSPSNSTRYLGTFSLTGCKGYPEATQEGSSFSGFQFLPQFKDTAFKNLRYREMDQVPLNDLAILSIFNLSQFQTILQETPGIFKITYPLQMSLIDGLLLLLQILFVQQQSYQALAYERKQRLYIPLGTFMPHFFEDGNRGYVIVPGFYQARQQDGGEQTIQKMFSDIRKFLEDVLALIQKYWQKLPSEFGGNFSNMLAALIEDIEYSRLTEELKVYQNLTYGLKFKNFYHPLACYLRSTLYRDGIPALMQRDTQLHQTNFQFGPGAIYQPNAIVVQPYPIEDLDFNQDGSYAGYNWELFFHLPFLVATKLNQNQRFEEAMNWFHYIFNPIGAYEGTAPQKYWVTKPFFLQTTTDYVEQRIDTLLNTVASDPSGATITELKFAIKQWRSKPFQPHVIARSRPVAYQKVILMKYIDNLIDWGDNLFRQGTMESVNQATQMYILADKLLGPKPRIIPPVVKPPYETYNQLEAKLDLFSNALLSLENLIPDLNLLPHKGAELPTPPITLSSLYFCIPQNEKLLEYWDRIGDRLFKIRHCQNIDGVERTLALFAPPIDPGALVRAAAAGLDISAVISGLNAPLPFYRFNVISQKATELIQEVRSLGASLLQALEKKDAEAMALLRSELELKVLNAVKAVKEQQIKEAETQIEVLKKSMKVTEEKILYYRSREFMNAGETVSFALTTGALLAQGAAMALDIVAGVAHVVPDVEAGASGVGGTPVATLKFGGVNVGNASNSWADVSRAISGLLQTGSGMASTLASYARRQEEWDFQATLGDKELEQYKLSDGKDGPQIVAAQIRLDIAKKDLQNHLLQIENAQKTDEFMRNKFTNKELYDWMIGQISSVYFRAYQLAYDVAKKAERCFQHELGSNTSFLQFGYWDSLKKGLMAADHLHHDLKRMEVAYLDQNKREYELTKHISLAMLDPMALVHLKNTGKCLINLPEALFNLDHPGQYMRRIKSVSLSIPCVVGPYTSVSCKLSLISNKYRKNATPKPGATTDKDKYSETIGNDDRFVYNIGMIQSIATSTAQNDSGVFELNFRDERYLPFEGTGAISTWQLEMPKAFQQFDFNTISDVIMHLKYTARDGGSGFKALAENVLKDLLNEMVLEASRIGLYIAFNLKHDLPNEWHKLKQAGTVSINLTKDRLPFYVQDRTPTITQSTWLACVKGNPASLSMSLNSTPFSLNREPALNNLCQGSSNPIILGTEFSLSLSDATNLEDVWLVCHYSIT
jgi:hypothetical protein